jgi:agmatine deiminase
MMPPLAAGGLSFWGGAPGGVALPGPAGFWYPEETDPHERTFMQWPVNRRVHDDPDFLADLQGTIADIANAIAGFEPVVMLAAAEHHKAIRKLVSAMSSCGTFRPTICGAAIPGRPLSSTARAGWR